MQVNIMAIMSTMLLVVLTTLSRFLLEIDEIVVLPAMGLSRMLCPEFAAVEASNRRQQSHPDGGGGNARQKMDMAND
jgi:hypothetical protein